jgi:hypothetical protein
MLSDIGPDDPAIVLKYLLGPVIVTRCSLEKRLLHALVRLGFSDLAGLDELNVADGPLPDGDEQNAEGGGKVCVVAPAHRTSLRRWRTSRDIWLQLSYPYFPWCFCWPSLRRPCVMRNRCGYD